MWVKGLDIVLEKLRLDGVSFESIKGISGGGQQHGSVFWKKGALKMLQNMDPSKFLHEELSFAFSLSNSPIWMDSSTTTYCENLEKAVGGPKKLSKLTGSAAYERFTGSQIAKIFDTKKEVFNSTERISLVSSFACSIFLGDYANIDYSDGSGMNLLDIRAKSWDLNCLNAVAPGETSELEAKLGLPIPTESVLGPISSYFVERFGFSPDCKIVSFTGDNPSSFAGMVLSSHDIAVSLGSSDTVFIQMENLPEEGFESGHIFVNPVSSSDSYMALICFKNGSLTRERIKSSSGDDDSWDMFNQILDSTPRGNFGNFGFYFDLHEILPKMKAGDYRFNKENNKVSRYASKEVEVRAVIEGQFLSRRFYAEKIGCKITKETRILATGGASSNLPILQVLSDIFNAPVYTQKSENSADLGACYRAYHSLLDDKLSFAEAVQAKLGERFTKICEPFKNAHETYDDMLERYDLLETKLFAESKQK